MENTEEIWKDIPGFEGHYQASTLGRIKSIERIVIRQAYGNYVVKEKVLSLHKHDGYCYAHLSKNAKSTVRKVSILMAITFLNHTPNGRMIVVDHIDNNSFNDRLDNLKIVSQRENASKDRCNKSSKYTGVCWSKKQKVWVAQISFRGKKNWLGSFSCEHEAGLAYKKALESCNT